MRNSDSPFWPHTSNSHVLVTHVAAAGTAPVSTFFLRWNLGLQDVPLDHLRADRVLQRGARRRR